MDHHSTILIVDDEQVIQETLARLLSAEGYNLAFASNGAEALTKAAQLTPDLILLDIIMPGMDGFEVCRRLRADPILAEVPIVMITALGARNARLQGIEIGADDFISKPFDDVELQAKVRTITRLNRYRRLHMERIQRQQTEGALRESEERYRIISELVSDYAYALRVEPDGTLVREWVTEAFTRITGFTPAEVDARGGWGSLIHPHDTATAYHRTMALHFGRSDVSEYRIVTKNDEIRWLRDYSRPIRNKDQGRVLHIVGAAQDITARRLAEEALHRRTEELEALRQLGLELAAELDLGSLLRSIVSRAVDLLKGDGGGLYLYRPDLDVLEWAVGVGQASPPAGNVLHRGKGFSGRVWEAGEPLIVDDCRHGEEWAAIYKDLPILAMLGAPIQWSEELLGVIHIAADVPNAFSEADAELLSLFASQAAVAIANARLFETEHTARKQLRDLAGYLQAAREEERTHIAREIHDEFGQALTALKMDLSWLAKRLPPDQPRLAEKVSAISDLVDSTVQTVRRVATELRPGLLDHLGLAAAIEWQAQEVAARTGFNCKLDLDDKVYPLHQDLTTAIFRIFQEALTNVARHAKATEVHITLEYRPDELVLTVRDDGRGITKSQVSGTQSLGLLGMRERARFWGGNVTFKSTPDQGTTVTVRVPRPNVAKEGGK